MTADQLHESAVATLENWPAPTSEQEALRLSFLRHLADHHDGWSRDCPEAHLTASSLVMSPDGAQVVLVFHRGLGRWIQSGGHIEETDTSIAEAALREAIEETGLPDLQIKPEPIQLDRHEVRHDDDAPPCSHLDVRYLIIADPEHAPVPETEDDSVEWFDVNGLPSVDQSVRWLIVSGQEYLQYYDL